MIKWNLDVYGKLYFYQYITDEGMKTKICIFSRFYNEYYIYFLMIFYIFRNCSKNLKFDNSCIHF